MKQQRSVRSTALALGVNSTSLHQRRDARYSPGTIERYGPTNELLAGLVEKLEIDAVVVEFGALPINVRRWQTNARIAGPVRKAIADMAERHSIVVGK